MSGRIVYVRIGAGGAVGVGVTEEDAENGLCEAAQGLASLASAQSAEAGRGALDVDALAHELGREVRRFAAEAPPEVDTDNAEAIGRWLATSGLLTGRPEPRTQTLRPPALPGGWS